MDYRSKEISKIGEDVPMGDVTNINLTMINGGVQTNVVPADIKLVFDIRLAVGLDQDAFEAMARKNIVSRNISLIYVQFSVYRSMNGVKRQEVTS